MTNDNEEEIKTNEREMILTLPTPMDLGYDGAKVTLKFKSEVFPLRKNIVSRYSCSFSRSRDGVLDGIAYFWQSIFSKRMKAFFDIDLHRLSSHDNYILFLEIGSLPIGIEKKKGIYRVNGHRVGTNELSYLCARLTIKAGLTNDINEMVKTLMNYLSLPEDVRYCLENKVPYYFYENWSKFEVRLNIEQIGFSEFAIEISDGIWGTISAKDLQVYCGYYLHNKKRTNWSNCRPSNLFKRLVGREPSDAERHLMIEFLKQNRTQDLVEDRAISLLRDIESKNENVKVFWSGNSPLEVAVRGKLFDWKLMTNPSADKNSLQRVQTYIWAQVGDEYSWNFCCVDNLSTNSPLGDQFASRILLLLNDKVAVEIVNTLRNYKSHVDKNKNERSKEYDKVFGM